MHRTESLRNRAGGGGEGKKDNTRKVLKNSRGVAAHEYPYDMQVL